MKKSRPKSQRKKQLIVIGAGGHAKVIIDLLWEQDYQILGIIDKNDSTKGKTILDVPVLGSEKVLSGYKKNKILLVNGVGSVDQDDLRKNIFNRFKKSGYSFETVIHPTAFVSKSCLLGEGSQIMAGSVIQAGSKIGDNVIVNTGVKIDHDCEIGSHSHIAPGVILSGTVLVGEAAHIGSGAVVIQGVLIKDRAFVGAGSVVTKNVEAGSRVRGVPARVYNKL